MYLQPNSTNGDEASEGISNPTLTTDLIIQTVSSCVQYKQSRWHKYIAIVVFIWRSRTKPRLRRAKAPHHQRFLNKVVRLDVRQKVSDLASYFKDRAAYIPLLAPTTPTTPTTPPAAASNHVIDIPLQDLKEVARIVRVKDLNALRARGGVDGVSTVLLRSHSEDHADDGGQVPQLACNPAKPVFFHFFLKACNHYTIFFLLGSAGLQFSIEFMKQGVKQGWHDGVAILVTVFLLVAFPSVGNYRNERKMVKQLMERNKFLVDVERNGESRAVMISHVSVGDIVHLKKGDHAPADGLFIDHGVELVLDEVLSPTIDFENNPFVLSGSKVIEGQGRMIVTSVGVDTAFAEMLSLVTEDPNPNRKTLLQALMDKPYTYMEYLACCVSILIAFVVLIRFLVFRKHDNYNDRPDLKGEVSMNLLMKIFEKIYFKTQGRVSTLASVLATVVIGIQHGMPFVISLALCQWKEKVVQNGVDPQNLSACVTMGLITVICIETTSEKMCNQMEVMDFWMGDKDLSNEVESDQTEQFALKGLRQEISATPANDSFISSIKTRWGVTDMEVLDQTFITLEERKLSSDEKCSGILMRKTESSAQDMQLHMSGDASTILDMCSHYNDKTGESRILEIQKRKFKQVIKNMEEKGLRPIAYAYKKTNVQEFTENGLKLLALVGVRCPYQEELKIAVEAFRKAGIRIKLVSEDELSIVTERASDLGIFNPGSGDMEIIAGEAFRRLNSMERLNKVDLISVMGSSLPRDKLLMVERLKKNGHIVAFYGGLTINDTRTLKEADVGITEDIWSTEMARDNADIIVKDGCSWFLNFKSGKCAYHNIQNFCQIQLTACISGLLVTLVATMHSGDSPLTAIHLIWVNLIMCLLGSLMMVMELERQEPLAQEPAPRTQEPAPSTQEPARTQPLITKAIWGNIASQVSYQASILLVLHFMGNAIASMNQGVRGTMVFNIYTLCQVLNLFRAMDLVNKEVLNVVLHSYWFLMALGAVMVMQVVIVEFGKGLASGVRLDAIHWASCFLLAALSWPFDWAITSQFQRENLAWRRAPMGMSRFYICASLFLIFSVSYCFESDYAHTT
ncbi:putative calcium-transporting ATPase [Rosa chinensis]|uniref:Putative calcium-transporting ATPase n=1 Tax=Rosa chinensis TaxID=74649 RepID=A0A2P6S1G8_ROSCH|nr:putative calcium-transporting ATPase 13, plasma membrane-type [Rosa chinensis]PRQ52534.1 putative calcium-transporting ATPase [Rosa chinensis]